MKFDVVVIGGGHAGVEAANAAANRGVSVLMITSHIDLIGHMSCNPAIGGIAKGNIVREIDAMGGLMGKIIDKTGIHFKMLNTAKGMAVWGNRAQADKHAYRSYCRELLESVMGISFLQGMVKKINPVSNKAFSVLMDSSEVIECTAIVLANGTFLSGTIHMGLTSFPGGRTGEPASCGLTESLAELGIKSGRLKTGTSPRIDGRSVDFSKMEKQPGDDFPWAFSFSTQEIPTNKVVCYATRTCADTHSIILNNLNFSPLYTGKIQSVGPRYCPSIEDKVVRFGERDGHALFLEPEGLHTHEMYLNGLSTSLPFQVQVQLVQSIPGLKSAKIIRPGYGIEYDFFHPTQLHPSLESRVVEGLFFAGQINGTSGYEEAGGQGLIAGVNAAQKVLGLPPLVLKRDAAYIGVLIDDLVSRGTQEPYRMFTSRAEHRLLLRQDTADFRLMEIAHSLNLVDANTIGARRKFWEGKKELVGALKITTINHNSWNDRFSNTLITSQAKAYEVLKRPEVSLTNILSFLNLNVIDRELICGVEADVKYSGFVARENQNVERMAKIDTIAIPQSINYQTIPGLLTESRIKLSAIKPATLGQAARISGVTPADVSILMVYVAQQ